MSGLKNIVVVLYQPQDIVNVGGVVRVMSNFGLRRLRLVEPAAYDPYRIEGIAHHTEKIVAEIERYATLEEALADCGFVLGTTARKRGTRREHLTPHQSAPYLLDYATAHSEAPAALLFGREDDGLPNEALDLCHALVTIPTDTANRSLNLAQAALVLAYELWITASSKSEVRSQKSEVIEDRGQGTGDREIQSIPTESSSSSFIPHPSENSPTPNPHPLTPTSRPAGAPPRWGDVPSALEALAAALAEDAELASGTDREEMFKALSDLLWTLHPDTTDLRVAYSMTRLRAILLRAAPRKEESRLLAHLFQHITRRVRPKERRPEKS